ncbi:MAG: YihY/virulence factor BrkB family protein [Flavisolibacter sp.]
MKRTGTFFTLLKRSAISFSDDNAFKLSASLSYYTIFALGPLLFIIISLSGFFYGNEAMQGRIYEQLKGLIGNDAALQVQNIIANASQDYDSITGAIIGAVILFIGATGVFTEIQSSINYIWSVKAKPKRGWLKYLGDRLLSFSLVVGLGFLLMVSLIMNALMSVVNTRVLKRFPDIEYIDLFNSLIILVIITSLFAVIYKILPDARIAWKDAWVGSTFTAILFLIGKFLIGFYMGNSNIGVVYGAAASIVVILVWVYYSSMILYFGAEFTKVYALHSGQGIRPKSTAVFIIKQEAKEVPPSRLDG